jgi:hypothetical protein
MRSLKKLVVILCDDEMFDGELLCKMLGVVRRRVGVVAGEALTMTGKEELEKRIYSKWDIMRAIYFLERSIDIGEHSGQAHLMRKRC